MKKYLLASAFLLATISVVAQKKNKRGIPPPPVLKVAVPVGTQETDTPNSVYAPVTESSLTAIRAKKLNGEEIRFATIKEFENFNLSQIKELVFITQISGKSLDAAILQKILNEAPHLEVVVINNFSIENFPEINAPNHKLKKLTLHYNNLKSLHPSISNLAALEDFSSLNPLEKLPETFSQLKNLKELGLNNVTFSEFPKEIFNLNKLSVLYISGNLKGSAKIKEIPDLFHQLPNLTEFGVTEASLSTLPKSVSSLKKLKKVSFSGNEFDDFPESLASNPKLTYVPFTSNPLNFDKFIVSIKKIKWSGLFFLNETGFSKKQYEEIQKILSKTDVYYDGMND